MENTIRKCTPSDINDQGVVEQVQAEEELKINAVKWSVFKEQIYEIYNSRINNSAEISGSINNSYMGMDESLIIYFLDKIHTRKRPEIES